ncbi:hypothetical protein M9H77_28005 [Catharanthus roseus]|uniref:Uncharacterized protein n=1 Tax=Catharanthus roseus TaxID=4058 RepID=A0ACC0AFK0_CATRO|nr:hypothetical protein M9H77_28005 [Catharanthus roseus]
MEYEVRHLKIPRLALLIVQWPERERVGEPKVLPNQNRPDITDLQMSTKKQVGKPSGHVAFVGAMSKTTLLISKAEIGRVEKNLEEGEHDQMRWKQDVPELHMGKNFTIIDWRLFVPIFHKYGEHLVTRYTK